MGTIIIAEWLASIIVLTAFIRTSRDMRLMFFASTMGAPLFLPILTIILTVLYFYKGN